MPGYFFTCKHADLLISDNTGGMFPAVLFDAHACGKEDAAKGQPARGAAARSASLESILN